MLPFPNMLLYFTIELQVLVMSQLTVEKFDSKGMPTLNKCLVKNIMVKIMTWAFN